MELNPVTPDFLVSAQLRPDDLAEVKAAGVKAVVCNRPDGEGADQPNFPEIEEAAVEQGLDIVYLPISQGMVSDSDVAAFKAAYERLPKPLLSYCRSGKRAITVWTLASAESQPFEEILDQAREAGYDLSSLRLRLGGGAMPEPAHFEDSHDVVIVGGGAAGIAAASSLLARQPDLDIAVIDPADVHYYQPGWTMVGAGVFEPGHTVKTMSQVLPPSVTWIKEAVAGFDPERDRVIVEGCRGIRYRRLVVCPGLKLNWAGVEGLEETLGHNGVTSNYRFDLAPYTWELVCGLKQGRALFTQPPMPIKCAGAPQKAMYLSADHWSRQGCLDQVEVEFYNAGPVLFGVSDYVPALMQYVKRYDAKLNFKHRLIAVDGPGRTAVFEVSDDDGTREVERGFDMMHVCPPQQAPDFIKASPLADAGGWLDVDQYTLRHKKFGNVFGLGDVTNSPNAKTAAAARKQAPVVAHNLVADLRGCSNDAHYDGYGSCPLTVERGRIVLAEFGFGGKLLPSFPRWLIDGQKPSRLAWLLKERMLPPIYWQAMLRGREWLAKPQSADKAVTRVPGQA